MPVIVPVEWDSRQLGLPVGRLTDFAADNGDHSMADYGLVLARVPGQNHRIAARLQDWGFRYIGLDLRLVAKPDKPVQTGDHTRWKIRRVNHSVPDFLIDGFHIEDSRLMLDPACRARLPVNFWDRLVYDHCAEFADVVICAVDVHDHLAGFVSCLMRPPHLDLFMVAVHPSHRGGGLGGALLGDAAALARERGLGLSTSVMTGNVRGFNFYIKHNYLVDNGEIIMHRWQEKVHDGQ